jgi:hypothetical protein
MLGISITKYVHLQENHQKLHNKQVQFPKNLLSVHKKGAYLWKMDELTPNISVSRLITCNIAAAEINASPCF